LTPSDGRANASGAAKGVPAWAWPEPSLPRIEREHPTADPVDRSQFVIVPSEDFEYKQTRFRAGAHLRKDNPLVAEILRRHPGWLVPAVPES
jgi:hypothetical protein